MEDQRLTPKQEIYCVARAEGLNAKQSAERACVAERTAWNWNREPAIWERIEALQEYATRSALRILRAKADRAAERVVECIEPGYNLGNAADTNLRAALAVLKLIGAEPPERRELSGPNGTPPTFNLIDYREDDSV